MKNKLLKKMLGTQVCFVTLDTIGVDAFLFKLAYDVAHSQVRKLILILFSAFRFPTEK